MLYYVWCCVVLYCVLLYCDVLCCVMLHCVMLWCVMLYHVVLCYGMLCCSVLCRFALYCVVLYCVMLHYTLDLNAGVTSTCKRYNEIRVTNVVKDGKLALRDDKIIKLWELLSVDLCGPWKIKCKFEEAESDVKIQTKTVQIWALTIIDEGSSWLEIAAITDKYAEEIASLVDDKENYSDSSTRDPMTSRRFVRMEP